MSEIYVYGRAAIGRRIGAFCVDYAVMLLLAFVPFFFFSGFGDSDSFFMKFPFVMAVAVGGVLFKDVFGRSLGKLVFGIVIAHGDAPDLPVTAWQRIKRNIPLLFWPVEVIMTFQSPWNRRLGDKWAHTLIAAKVRKKKSLPVILTAVLGGALFLSFIIFGAMNIMRNDSSYKAATAFIQSQEEIVSEVGAIERFGAPSGSQNYSNGYGSARYKIRVVGEDDTITVSIYLTKKPDGEWVVEDVDW